MDLLGESMVDIYLIIYFNIYKYFSLLLFSFSFFFADLLQFPEK